MADATWLNVPTPPSISPTPLAVQPTLPGGVARQAQVATQVQAPQAPSLTLVTQQAGQTLAGSVQSVLSAPQASAVLVSAIDRTSPIGRAGLAHEPVSGNPVAITPALVAPVLTGAPVVSRGPGVYNAVVEALSPALFWPLDESSGSVAIDASGNGRNGTYNAPVTLGAAGLLTDGETAISVDDATGAGGVSITADVGAGPTGSIEMWMKPSQISGNIQNGLAALNVASSNGLAFVTNTDGTIFFSDIVGGIFTNTIISAVIAAGQTVHLVLTFDGTTLTAYVNGVSIGSIPAGPIPGAWDAFALSGNAFAGEMHGAFEKIAVYPTALSAAQVAANYAAGTRSSVVTTVVSPPTPIGVPSTPPIVSAAVPTAVPAPTLATSGPAQGTPSPRIIGKQMVPQTPADTQTSSQLAQEAATPQTLPFISTMDQG